MTTDRDLSTLLPDPPPPRPAAREAALAEALRRFDGHGTAPTQRPGVPLPPARPVWARPQFALLASAVLVVLVSVPIWWTERDRIAPSVGPTAVTTPKAVEPARAPGGPRRSASAAPMASTPPAAAPAEPAPPSVPVDVEANVNKLPQFAPADRPAAAADAAVAGEATLAQRAAPPPPAAAALRPSPPPPPPPPPAPRVARQAAAEAAVDEADANIVVTGSRRESAPEARAPIPAVADAAPLDGAWNACTLDDPRRNPTVCRGSTRASEGLALAWQGNLDRAIRAFDRAIAAEPDLALAYLNRGLAWQRKGDLDRALADLNRAVARDRTDARAYYHRSRVYRARGEEARAAADAERAIELDPDYAAALR